VIAMIGFQRRHLRDGNDAGYCGQCTGSHTRGRRGLPFHVALLELQR
jgi:hypothetical protein